MSNKREGTRIVQEAQVREKLLEWLRANNQRVAKEFNAKNWHTVPVAQLAFPETPMPAYGTKWEDRMKVDVITVAYSPAQNEYIWINGHSLTVAITKEMNIRPLL